MARSAAPTVLLVVLAFGLGVSSFRISEGYHWDEGHLAYFAYRVLHGQTPHVDFKYEYFAALAYVHAAFAGMFGLSLFKMRVLTLAVGALVTLTLLRVGRTVVPPPWHAMAPIGFVFYAIRANFLAPYSTHFCLVFGALAILAALRYETTGRHRWLALAGAMMGVSFAVKQTQGAFQLAALLLWLAGRGMVERSRVSQARQGPGLATGLILGIATAFVVFVAAPAGPGYFIHLYGPVLALALPLAVRSTSEAVPASTLAGEITWACGGFVLAPAATVIAGCARSGWQAAMATAAGLLGTPRVLVESVPAHGGFPGNVPGTTLVVGAVLVWLLLLEAVRRGSRGAAPAAAAAALLGTPLWLLGALQPEMIPVTIRHKVVAYFYQASGLMTPILLLLSTAVTLGWISSHPGPGPLVRSRLLMVTAFGVTHAYVAFPLAQFVYFAWAVIPAWVAAPAALHTLGLLPTTEGPSRGSLLDRLAAASLTLAPLAMYLVTAQAVFNDTRPPHRRGYAIPSALAGITTDRDYATAVAWALGRIDAVRRAGGETFVFPEPTLHLLADQLTSHPVGYMAHGYLDRSHERALPRFLARPRIQEVIFSDFQGKGLAAYGFRSLEGELARHWELAGGRGQFTAWRRRGGHGPRPAGGEHPPGALP